MAAEDAKIRMIIPTNAALEESSVSEATRAQYAVKLEPSGPLGDMNMIISVSISHGYEARFARVIVHGSSVSFHRN